MLNTIKYKGQLIPVTGTILQTLEKSNVPVQSHCREGFCGACRVKLKQGEVGYTTDPIGFVDDDEVLACCSVPTSDNVEVELQ
jgi:ferredoxin